MPADPRLVTPGMQADLRTKRAADQKPGRKKGRKLGRRRSFMKSISLLSLNASGCESEASKAHATEGTTRTQARWMMLVPSQPQRV